MTLQSLIQTELQALLAQSPNPPLEWMTPTETAEWLRISTRKLASLTLPYVMVGDTRRYHRDDVIEYLRKERAA